MYLFPTPSRSSGYSVITVFSLLVVAHNTISLSLKSLLRFLDHLPFDYSAFTGQLSGWHSMCPMSLRNQLN